MAPSEFKKIAKSALHPIRSYYEAFSWRPLARGPLAFFYLIDISAYIFLSTP